MYTWSNEKRLDTLNVEGEDNKLIFQTAEERAEVFIVDGDIDKVIFTETGKDPVTITKDERSYIVVGEGNWERDVYHFLKPGGPAPTMRLGITSHKGIGTWSSLPHDFELNTEKDFEEVFFYILDGGPQRAIQVGKGVWHDNTPVDDVWKVEHNSFGTIPMGYHPVVAEPHVHVSYIWVYLAKKKEWEKI